jgi:hypothetical protein
VQNSNLEMFFRIHINTSPVGLGPKSDKPPAESGKQILVNPILEFSPFQSKLLVKG